MRHTRGFTLIELLVAMTMFALLTTASFAALSAGTRAAAKTKRLNNMISYGQAALEIMASDIRAATVYEDFTLVSLDRQYDGIDTDTIDFVAAKAPRLSQEGMIPLGHCEVGYYIEIDPDTDFQWLVRREDGSVDDDPLEGGAVTQAGLQVAAMNLQFYDGLFWQSGWDDEEELPLAVNVQLGIIDTDKQENPIVVSTTIPIMAQP